MNRIKTLSVPLISALAVWSAAPADAQVALQLSSKKTYRQLKDGTHFRGGSFDIRFDDGHVSSIAFCNDPNYFPPGFYRGICSPGTAGFLSSGSINGATIQRPYLVVTALVGAVVVEPNAAKLISLNAAPASTLPRPSGGFTDDSASIYYNLNTASVQKYNITGYFANRNYTKTQRGKFESDIVPGAYHYSFPRLGFPNLPAPITAVIYPMPEGLSNLNHQETGFAFTKVNKNVFNPKGFLELSYLRPNEIRWKGLTPSNVFAAVDNLYFSMRALRNPDDPAGSEIVKTESIFPPFTNGGDPRVLLANPYVSSFTTPPIFPSGTDAMVEIEIQRGFQTGGVTYDFSNRRFQLPVTVVDRFTEYAEISLFGGKKASILEDNDGDGYNNLSEWILDSSSSDATSVPIPPTPAAFQAVDIIGAPMRLNSYFGFNVNVKRGTIPKVQYTLQRSTDQGKTWNPFKTDNNWTVKLVKTITRNISTTQIQVRSKIPNPNLLSTQPFLEPPGTLSDIYRVKIALAK